MLVAEALDRRAAGTVEDLASISGNEPHAVASNGDGRGLAQAAMKDAALLVHDL